MTDTASAPEAPDTPRAEPPLAETPPPAAKPRRRKPRFLRWLAATGLLVILAILGVSQWERFIGGESPPVASGPEASLSSSVGTAALDQLRGDIADLRARLDAVDARLSDLQRASAQSGAASEPALAGIASRLSALESRVGTLESDMTRAADKGVQTALQERVMRLEMQTPDVAVRHAAAILAYATLVRAAQGAAPFESALDALATAVPGDPSLARLGSIARTGAPTRAMLTARFPDIARAALSAERRAAPSGNLLNRVWVQLRELVSIRRVGGIAGDTDADRLARAQMDLDAGDLEAATNEVGALGGAAADAAAPWLMDARARLTLDQTLDAFDARVLGAYAVPSQPEGASAP